MFDGHFRANAERTLKPVGQQLKRTGITADHLTLTGVVVSLGAAVAIGNGALRLGLVLLVLTSLPDLLDGAVAKALGAGPEAARDVGQAMAQNPVPLIIPCHRVLAVGGKVGGFSAPGGSATKARMLELEGVNLRPPAPAQQSFGF